MNRLLSIRIRLFRWTIAGSLLFVPAALCAPAANMSAQTSKKAPRRSQPVAPDTTGTIKQSETPKPQAAPPVLQDEGPLPEPFNLPTASRARMRACGESWQALKMSGRAASETWRAYATKCLASQSGPDRTAPR